MDLPARLAQRGLTLPPAPKPVAAYVPAVVAGDLVFLSGQLPMVDGKLSCIGRVPGTVSVDAARAAARQCALNALAVLGDVLDGNWSRLRRIVRVGVFVASDPGFTEQAQVANGASEFLVEVLGDPGRHARAAVGAAELPLGAAVELEMIAQSAG